MPRMVHCVKLKQELPGMPYKPFDDALGQRIFDEISFEAWKAWVEHSKMIVNENRLELGTKRAHDLLHDQCEQYFFGQAAPPPPEYVAPK
jgi:Fe-S cluster biosynthesis and repair protein YggX